MGQLTGRMIGNYRIVAKLGEGGMGKVYRAVDVMIEREVALKALRPEIANQEGVVERFRSEAVLLAKLNHPAIAQLYTFFNDGDEFYMVMEYVPGETLENLIRRDGAMPWQRALRYAVQTLEGIGHAHALGVLHRDLKPANIILTPGGKAKIMDFGIARALGAARMTRDGRVIGTLEYLAPERIQGKPADIRSDLYSVGMVLYEMITGRLPFQTASEYELLMAQVQQTPPWPRDLQIDLPAPVEAALMKSLAKDPMERCPDAVAFADELTSLLPASSISQARIPSALKETRLAEPADELMGTAPAPLPQRISGFPAVMPSLAGKPLAILAGLFLIAGLASAFVVFLFHRTAKPAATAALVHQAAVTPPQPASSPVSLPEPIVLALRGETQLSTPLEPRAPNLAHQERQVKTQRSRVTSAASTQPRHTAALDSTNGAAGAGSESGVSPAPADVPAVVAPVQKVVLAPRHATSLAEVHVLYVDAPEELGAHIRDELNRQLSGRFSLANSADSADAVMRVTLASIGSGKISKPGRVLGFKDSAQVQAVILAAGSAQPIWQQEVDDRKPIIGAFHRDSSKRLAVRIVKDLRDDLR